ncbi:hypothetical protein GN958_ATG15954 [Phytophthora infestans]|uniref:Uncharacterized protein n=1 Tax=Phytophthora infestans TaxID=4787 RepID=A0A8S9U8W4_PHYIN|nr:hypothetical protein GN958_ATG15954 [Phytophthora infestans]
MARHDLPVHEQFVFVYLTPIVKATDGIRRATADRVRTAVTVIASLQAQVRERFGWVSFWYPSSEGTPLALPKDSTMQQDITFDAAAADLQEL